MNGKTKKLSVRWLYLAVGTVSMLFAGIIYAWSILKTPFSADLGWPTSSLALNFTLTMCFFCVGGFLGSLITRKLNPSLTVIIAGVLAGAGFVLTSALSGAMYPLLFLTYALAAGLGIGIFYNVIISTVNAWFPDKRGLSSGCLLMGFGASTLIFGTIVDAMFSSMGWRNTFLIFGAAMSVVIVVTGLIISRPGPDMEFPAPKRRPLSARRTLRSRTTPQGR